MYRRTSTSMRAFCIAASCCTWRMTAVFGSLGPNELIVNVVCFFGGIGGIKKLRIASKVCESLGSGSRVEKLSTSRAALLASVVPQPKTPALHAGVIEWPFQTPSLSFENSSTSESPTRAAIFFSQLQSLEALFLFNSKTEVSFHSFCAPICRLVPWGSPVSGSKRERCATMLLAKPWASLCLMAGSLTGAWARSGGLTEDPDIKAISVRCCYTMS